MSSYLSSDTDQGKRALKDVLQDDELDGVTGGLVVPAIIAILISPLVQSPTPKGTSN